jgi:Tfp pilus assembly protein PilV
MSRQNNKHFGKRARAQAGLSLIETVIALALLMVVAVTVMSLGAVALTTTENQGHLQARTAEYAQDKMEQLLALTFCDNSTDTTVYPAVPTAQGTGLSGCTPTIPPAPLAGGGLNINAPVAGYVDYVDSNGNPTGVSANWQYVRVWQISLPAGSTFMKEISVTCQARSAVGGKQVLVPQSTVVALKSYPF